MKLYVYIRGCSCPIGRSERRDRTVVYLYEGLSTTLLVCHWRLLSIVDPTQDSVSLQVHNQSTNVKFEQ